MKHINLLPGWAMAAETMQPLREALLEHVPNISVDVQPLPALQLSSLETDLSSLAQQLKPGILVGWSLGGMLAVQLNRRFPEHFPRVVTLASNACLIERKDWSSAMPADTFKAFYQSFRDDPEKTLKRFAILVTQGSEQAKQLTRELRWDALTEEQRLHGLAILGMLDNRVVLRNLLQPMLHCFGAQDALVPVVAAKAVGALHPASRVAIHDQASHALPLEQPLWLAKEINDWLETASG